MKITRLLIGGVSLLLVTGIAIWEMQGRTSPGPLHPSHAEVPALRGGAGCVACHGNKETTLTEACAACHAQIQAQIENATGLHGGIPPVEAAACGACHREHTGGALALVADLSFRAAGVTAPEAYDHRHAAGYDLAGKHAALECYRCHPNAHAPMLEAGQRRFMGLSRECASCHADPHEGSFGAGCVACHGQAHAFQEAPGFTHTDKFRLEGAHLGPACAECHAKTGPTSVATLHGGTFVPRECVACHQDPHEGTLGRDCASCHGITRPFDQAAEFRHTAAFPLIGGHEGLACKSCHDGTGPYSVPALRERPGTAPRACIDCHPSPHRPATIERVAAALGGKPADACTECHAAEHVTFLGPTARMTTELHRATGFALDPPHAEQACAACHPGFGERDPLPAGPERPALFAALFPGRGQTECRACHQDPHRGQFDAGPTRGDCIRCHAPTHFAPSEFDAAHHEASRFPLTGAHRAVACAMCHEQTADGRRFVPTPTACAECHSDVHEGRFDRPQSPPSPDGAAGCARCHTTESFRAVRWDRAAHAMWTGYELKGAHAGASCEACHKRADRPDARGRSLGIAPRDCNACHTDPHAGQFRVGLVTDCARCHTETPPFARTSFDHQRDSAFKLDEHHATLACAACHRPVEVAPGRLVVRYRPLGTRCQDCHAADPRGDRGGRP